MTARLLGHALPGTPAGREYRAGRLGASEVGIVLGLAPESYGSTFALWHEKSGLLDREDTPTDPMTVGRYAEAAIREWLTDKHAGEFHVSGPPGTYVSTERDWQLATPDGLAHRLDNGRPFAVVECKFAAYSDGWGAEGTAEIPPHYLAQVTQQMDVLDLDLAYVAVLFGGEARFAEFVVPRLDENVRIVRDAGAAFVDSLGDPTRRPPIDGTEATLSTVRRSHPEIDDEQVRLPGDLVAEYLATLDLLDAVTVDARRVKAEVLDAMGPARIACDNNGTDRLRRQPGARGAVALHRIKPRKAPTNGTL